MQTIFLSAELSTAVGLDILGGALVVGPVSLGSSAHHLKDEGVDGVGPERDF